VKSRSWGMLHQPQLHGVFEQELKGIRRPWAFLVRHLLWPVYVQSTKCWVMGSFTYISLPSSSVSRPLPPGVKLFALDFLKGLPNCDSWQHVSRIWGKPLRY
jgi:hypothetical protein